MSSYRTDRVVQKRASHACQHCRVRRIKCDVEKAGVPCHNCVFSEVECVVPESKRSRRYRLLKQKISGLISLPSLDQRQDVSYSSNHPLAISRNKKETDESREQQELDGTDIPSVQPFRMKVFQRNPNTKGHSPIPELCSRSAQLINEQRQYIRDLPSYIQPPRQDMKLQDIELLLHQGAMAIPEADFRDQTLWCFVHYVYPYMPIIDLQNLFDAMDGHGSSKISLTLFQAVLFAGTAYVDIQVLVNAGYENRRAARADYYRKLKMLYDFDWDLDRVVIIQSLLFATHWYVFEEDQKDPWYWLGVCISIATSIGMDQAVTYEEHTLMTPRNRRLWRRIWWVCIMRDRTMAITMRRPLQIIGTASELPSLTLDDFDTDAISTRNSLLQSCPILRSTIIRLSLAEMCVAHADILLCMGHIIQNLYYLAVLGYSNSVNGPRMLYQPRTSGITAEQITMVRDRLDHWRRDLPSTCRFLPNAPGEHDAATENVLFLHKAVLRMSYLMAKAHLNRPFGLMREKSVAIESTCKLQAAAEKMAEMFQHLQERSLVSLLPPLSVGFIMFSLPAFLVKKKEENRTYGNWLCPQFHCCVRALGQLREIWPIADYACFLISRMISKSHLHESKSRLDRQIPTSSNLYDKNLESSTFEHPSTRRSQIVDRTMFSAHDAVEAAFSTPTDDLSAKLAWPTNDPAVDISNAAHLDRFIL